MRGRYILSLLFVLQCATVQASNVDWKMYGGASVAGPSFCFYDANTVTRASNGFVRVWTKCLAQKDLDGVKLDDDIGKRILDGVAKRVIAGYVPPIIVIGQMEFNQLPDVAAYEEIADISAIQPQAEIFDELNCGERMRRNLSITIHTNGRSNFQDKPSEWKYVPPEGNAATLLSILCAKQ
jgi:hypothetical protein